MSLSWRDVLASLLAVTVAGIVLMSYAKSSLLLNDYRVVVIVLAVLGMLICGLSSFGIPGQSSMRYHWVVGHGTLGILGLLAIIGGLITGHGFWILLLGAIILILWFLTTMRHTILRI